MVWLLRSFTMDLMVCNDSTHTSTRPEHAFTARMLAGTGVWCQLLILVLSLDKAWGRDMLEDVGTQLPQIHPMGYILYI